jgi:hypothetical protein
MGIIFDNFLKVFNGKKHIELTKVTNIFSYFSNQY